MSRQGLETGTIMKQPLESSDVVGAEPDENSPVAAPDITGDEPEENNSAPAPDVRSLAIGPEPDENISTPAPSNSVVEVSISFWIVLRSAVMSIS